MKVVAPLYSGRNAPCWDCWNALQEPDIALENVHRALQRTTEVPQTHWGSDQWTPPVGGKSSDFSVS